MLALGCAEIIWGTLDRQPHVVSATKELVSASSLYWVYATRRRGAAHVLSVGLACFRVGQPREPLLAGILARAARA
jgi:hypothetical protein